MIRFGLCCIFRNEPIKFRTTTAKALSTHDRPGQLAKLSAICRENAENILAALQTCDRLGIGAFRVLSPLFPRFTHPDVGYRLDDLPQGETIRSILAAVDRYRRDHDLRLSFHPDQFVVLSSTDPGVVARSAAELEYQGEVAEMIGAEVITLHVGGAQGSKEAALERLRKNLPLLSGRVRSRLALENDDVSYTVRDLLPLCTHTGIPLVYDVHHHRCNPDGLTVGEATALAGATWRGREPWLHVSSPKGGWGGRETKSHADYVDIADFPEEWIDLDATVDVEAKGKELAVLRLMTELTPRLRGR